MDIETIKRIKGDFNHTSNTMKMNSQKSQGQQATNQSYLQSEEQTEKTQSLTIMFNNIIDLNLKEIIALYDQIDKKIFYHVLGKSVIIAEFNKFNDVSQFENQRIVLNYCKNSFVVAGYILQTQQLVVLKEIEVRSQETLIQHLDEYKIHYKINQLFPTQSLELIIPVKVEKGQNFYQLLSCMERAQFNLYDYSRNHQIGEEEAMNIFIQILDQIINLHSVNIAHRDVKPQNIFYVKEKGWLLSDFGESLEYQQIEGLYNIRGTKYFLIPNLQSSIHKNGKYDQNLMTNDTYALVVTMIMIKNQQYINDMKNQIENLRDDLLKQFIQLQNLTQLIQFRETIQFNVNKNLINLTKSCYKELNAEEQEQNFRCNIFSQVSYIAIQNIDNLDPIWLQNFLKIVKKNYKFIIQKFSNVLPIMLMNSCLQKIDIKLELNKNFFKMIQEYPQQKQEFYLDLLFIYGYTEKLINLGNEYLNKHYSQSVHILLIDSYYRANMPLEAEKQLKQFNEGMVFDQINTNSQNKYLQYLYHLNGEQLKNNVQFDINIESELYDRGLQEQNDFMIEFLKEQQLLQNDPYLNREKIVNSIIQRVDLICRQFSLLNTYTCKIIFLYIQDQPLYVFLSILQKIHQQHYGYLDKNRKFTFLQQITESFIMLNQKQEFMQNLKLMKKNFFHSESQEQTICFKIQYQTIHFLEYLFQEKNYKFNFNLHMRKFVNELNKIKQIKFKCYFQYINGSLLKLIRTIKKFQIYHKNHYLVYIIQFIINLAFKHNFHIMEYDRYQLFHIQAQLALIDLKNDKRSQLLVQSQKKFLNEKASQIARQKKMDRLNYQIRPSIKKILSIRNIKSQLMNKMVTKEFIFNRFFEV